MLHRVRQPLRPLRDFIEDYWLYDGYTPLRDHERILPSGTFELVFNLREDEFRIHDPSGAQPARRYSGAMLSGPYAAAFASDAAEEVAIMGVHFRPGGAHPFLELPASDLANRHIDLGDLWGRAAGELRERLASALEPAERFQLLEAALLTHLLRPLERHSAVASALHALGERNFGGRTLQLARDAGLSERRFIELFQREVGLRPKLYQRIRRFHRVLGAMRGPAPSDWAALALDCGYFDQSHLIRDVTEFSGLTPAACWRAHAALRRAGAHIKRNHLAIDSSSVFSNTR